MSSTPLTESLRENAIRTVLFRMLLEKRIVATKDLGVPPLLKSVSPLDWNVAFQEAYLVKYAPNADPAAWQREHPKLDLDMLHYLGNLPRCMRAIAAASKALMQAEGSLIALAMEKLIDDNFEAVWTALAVGTKQDIVLDGLVRAAHKAREYSRFSCPEMCLFTLVGEKAGSNKNYSLVSLLKAIVAHDPTGNGSVKSLYLFAHPAIDREFHYVDDPHASDDLRAFGYLRIIQRNLYIVEALIAIVEVHSGEAAPAVFDTGADQNACNCCNTRVKFGEIPLTKCTKCRQVSYCSVECQLRDWPDHKKLCGVNPEVFDITLVTPTPEKLVLFIGCPTPDATFVRSPALWRQIHYLSKTDSYTRDYHFDVGPKRTRSVRLVGALRLLFLVARRRAMASGDPTAVAKMHAVLHGFRDAFGLTAEQIRRQLEREYRVTLPAVPTGPFGPLPTPAEIGDEMRDVRRREACAGVGEVVLADSLPAGMSFWAGIGVSVWDIEDGSEDEGDSEGNRDGSEDGDETESGWEDVDSDEEQIGSSDGEGVDGSDEDTEGEYEEDSTGDDAM
ncbi:hypothetical protein C8R46DRAFT_1218177 [Mycena filopes]|nr:hypothetical protein C8R46DRAFT_1218177 [Mycena filopes]